MRHTRALRVAPLRAARSPLRFPDPGNTRRCEASSLKPSLAPAATNSSAIAETPEAAAKASPQARLIPAPARTVAGSCPVRPPLTWFGPQPRIPLPRRHHGYVSSTWKGLAGMPHGQGDSPGDRELPPRSLRAASPRLRRRSSCPLTPVRRPREFGAARGARATS